MIMKDGKRIIIRTPFLKNLRKNLRELIHKAYRQEHRKLSNKVIETIKVRENQKDENIIAQMTVEIRNLSARLNKLRASRNKSILKCGMCGTLDDDRIYYKGFDEWFCLKCYEENYKDWPPLNWKPQYPLSKNQVESFFFRLDKLADKCQTNLNLSKKILTDMGIKKSDQKIFLETLYHYGGHCDCEIMLNAHPKVMMDFDIDIE